ncbi:type I-E CRISPR-associated protein Cas6/Cse3/CasE [bacterium]|nr:type I-E CRISPR-associated protein Cas6/Cse3/CasE [candidate division CSSED10-310 bacterium]
MELHLTKFLIETRGLMRLQHFFRIPPDTMDLGYLVHCGISQAFHSCAPKVFSVMDRYTRMNNESSNHPRFTQVLGYTKESASTLINHAKTYAEPDILELFDLDQIQSKTVPMNLPIGHLLEFRVKTCPIIRIWRETNGKRRQVERDAWLARVKSDEEMNVPDYQMPDRETVYSQWFVELINRQKSVSLVEAHMSGLKLDRLVRKTRNRTSDPNQSKRLDRPVAVFQGLLNIQNSESFNDLLYCGIGRHKSFGFGMLLLKPAGAR